MSYRQLFGFITKLLIFTSLKYLVLFNVYFASAEVSVVNFKNFTITYFEDREAEFGPSLSDHERKGYLIYATPRNACQPIGEPPEIDNKTSQWIALIARGDCDFSVKVIHAQEAGFSAAIVHNYKGLDRLVPMGAGSRGNEVDIPSVFIGGTDGEDLAEKYCYRCQKLKGYYHVTLSERGGPPSPYLLWPFAVVVGTCFVLMLTFMVFKWCRDVRRKKKSRLSSKHLKKIPVKKFKKGDEYDTCAICLDDYEEGEKMRILPCSHAYHCKCIDPWLTKNKRTCPVCKRKVFPGTADSDSESDDGGGSASASERTPLLAGSSSSSETSSRHSTFDSSDLPGAVTVRPNVTSLSTTLSDDDESDSDASLELGAVGGVDRPVGTTKEYVVVESEPAQVNNAYSSDDDVGFSAESTSDVKKLSQVV